MDHIAHRCGDLRGRYSGWSLAAAPLALALASCADLQHVAAAEPLDVLGIAVSISGCLRVTHPLPFFDPGAVWRIRPSSC